MNNTNTEVFLDKYKQLEDTVRSVYNLSQNDSIAFYLEKQNQYKNFAEEIRYCRDVRNLLAHKRKIKQEFAVEPSIYMIEFIDNIIEKVKHRIKCKNIFIDIQHVFWQNIEGNVKSTMQIMRQKLYTHIPILQNGIVTGVFDENSIFNYLAEEELICIEDSLTFKDIEKYLSISDREMEEFIFIDGNCYVDELEVQIERAFHQGKRIGLAFITEGGNEKHKLQGIITPWDIISSKK